MISVITRTYNRLEYTIRTILGVIQATGEEEYEHLIVDNNSQDGTKEWLYWVSVNCPYFSKIRPFLLESNLGDWGGMRYGSKVLNPDSEFTVQLDNDIYIPSNWLTIMKKVIETTGTKAVVLKRTGTGGPLSYTGDSYKVDLMNYGKITVRPVRYVCGCYMLRTKDFKYLVNKMERCMNITQVLGSSLEIDFPFIHMDGPDEMQSLKYPREKTWKAFLLPGNGDGTNENEWGYPDTVRLRYFYENMLSNNFSSFAEFREHIDSKMKEK